MDQILKDFYFFSDFVNQPVFGPDGQKIGRLSDLVAERAEPYPMLSGFVVRTRGKSRRYVSWDKISRVEPRFTILGEALPASLAPLPTEKIVLLREEVMD